KDMYIRSADVKYRQHYLSILLRKDVRKCRGIVSGVVEELDFQPVTRVIKSANSLQEPANHIALIVDRQLNSYLRKVFVPRRSFEFFENTAVLDQSFSAVAAEPQE